jgi:hypothetical protein
MKTQYFALAVLTIALTACGEKPQQVQYVPQQYAAPVQAAPAPVIVNAPANNGSDAVLGLAAGAALGAVTANALNNNNRGYDRGYSREPRVINNTTVIKEKKVVVVQAPQQKPTYSQTQPITPKVNLSKPTISSQSYKSPTVTMKQSSPSTSYGKR